MIALPALADERVELRAWRLEDAPALRPACGDPDICRFTTVPLHYTVEDAQAWIERQQAHAAAGDAAALAIIPCGHAAPVGMVGLFGLAEPELAARFGYWVVQDWRGRGLAGAACALVAAWGFERLGLEVIHVDREADNAASARVAQRLGAGVTGSRMVVHGCDEIELIRHTIVSPAGR